MNGVVFDIKRFAVHDGGGIRSTLFLKGCPLRCPWCQNPEGLRREIRIWHHPASCIRCGACVAACPAGALSLNGRVHVDPGRLQIHVFQLVHIGGADGYVSGGNPGFHQFFPHFFKGGCVLLPL